MRILLLIFMVLSSLKVAATEQVMDKLEFDGQEYFIGIECKGLMPSCIQKHNTIQKLITTRLETAVATLGNIDITKKM